MLRRTTLSAFVLAAVLVGSAHAGDLFTPPMTAGDGNYLECGITNVSKTTKTVTIEIYGFCHPSNAQCNPGGEGTLLAAAGPLLVGPLSSNSLSQVDTGPAQAITPHVCKFIVQGSEKDYRASACSVSAAGFTNASLTCLPAQ